MVRLLIAAFLLLSFVEGKAQFATVSISRNTVIVEQPVKVKVTAYSPTWFAEPLSFKNLQVNGAFIQSFSRTISGIKHVKNKQYATLEFYYILFPYQEGEIVFPELEITTSIPPEGDYKGIPITLKTKPITITVKGIPEYADQDHWLVADNATIDNRWSTDIEKVRVGDVITRTITIRAAGTLPSFIDEPAIGQVDFASVYTSEPTFFDDRDDKKANGRRVDVYSYLLEEEGTFTVPEVEISWYNPHAAKYYSRKLPEYDITVSENLEMNSLQQLKDSLNAMNQALTDIETEESEAIDLLKIAQWAAVLIIALIILSWLWRIVGRLRNNLKQKRIAYQDSEAYWFDKMNKEKREKSFLNSLYQWIDRTDQHPKMLRTISSDDPTMAEEVDDLSKKYFSKHFKGNVDVSQIKSGLKRWRKNKKSGSRKSNRNILTDLNP